MYSFMQEYNIVYLIHSIMYYLYDLINVIFCSIKLCIEHTICTILFDKKFYLILECLKIECCLHDSLCCVSNTLYNICINVLFFFNYVGYIIARSLSLPQTKKTFDNNLYI